MNFRLFSLAFAVLFVSACGVDDASLGGEEFAEETLSNDELALINNGRFETFQGQDGQYYFHLLAGNGQCVLRSEGYASYSSSQNGVTSVQNNGVNEGRYLLREAADGSWYFLLTATNGQIIGISQMYSTESNAKAGITAVINVVKNTNLKGPAAQGAIRFEVFKGMDARYYFHLKAANGEVVLQSQGYASRSSANSGVTSVKTNGLNPGRYEVREAKDGKKYFVLKASNGRVIGISEMYETAQGAQGGIASVLGAISFLVNGK
ncbi:MAG: DUF1508 domain-containing protein [Myxococcota bacterium]